MVTVIRPVVVLFSGGIDSLGALVWARERYGPKNVLSVYCDVGQRYAEKEITAVKEICVTLNQDYIIEKRLFLGDLELPPEQNAIIPYRNTLFMLLGALHLPEDERGTLILQNIVVGESSTWDRRLEFNEAIQNLLDFADPRRVEIKVPHQSKTKTAIVQYLKDKVPEEVILRTVGCYSEGEGNCGACNSCFRSYVALVNADIPSPERRFKKNPLDWEEGIRGYVNRMVSGQYEQVRVDETFTALAKAGVLDRYVGKTYAIDLDGTIVDTMPGKFDPTMTSEEVVEVYKRAPPNREVIDRVNELYDEGNVIIIHTARYPEDEELTKTWLGKYGVKYHRLVLGKPRADYYVDDKILSIEDFKGDKRVMKISEKKKLLRQSLMDRGFDPEQIKLRKKPYVLVVRPGVAAKQEYLLTCFYKTKPDLIRHQRNGERINISVPEEMSRGKDGISRLADMMWVLAKYVGMI